MPWNSRYSPVTVPRTGPASVGTISVAALIPTPELGVPVAVSSSWPCPTPSTTRPTPGPPVAGRPRRRAPRGWAGSAAGGRLGHPGHRAGPPGGGDRLHGDGRGAAHDLSERPAQVLISERQHAADQGPPGDRADDAVDRDRGDVLVQGPLEGADGGVGPGTEDPVDGDGVAAGPQQVLEGLDGMVLVALADQWPGADGGRGHLRL